MSLYQIFYLHIEIICLEKNGVLEIPSFKKLSDYSRVLKAMTQITIFKLCEKVSRAGFEPRTF